MRSLHRSGSLRDQVSRFARNLPSDAIATVQVVAGLRWWLRSPASIEPLAATGLAILVLGERMSAPAAAGSLLLPAGLFVVSLPARPRHGLSWDGRRSSRYDGGHATGAVKVETTTGERE